MRFVLIISVMIGLAACGGAGEHVPVETEIIDTGNIQDGTVVDKTLDIDTTAEE